MLANKPGMHSKGFPKALDGFLSRSSDFDWVLLHSSELLEAPVAGCFARNLAVVSTSSSNVVCEDPRDVFVEFEMQSTGDTALAEFPCVAPNKVSINVLHEVEHGNS